MMMTTSISQSMQDYLKAIFDLTLEEPSTSTTAIAERLAVAPASVTAMLQKLASSEPPLVLYQKHHGVELTAAGRQTALAVLRRHRLLEQFLVDVLGFPWSAVHAESERLEHVISPLFEERMAEMLGNPDFDPHGDPIPSRDLAMPAQTVVPLSRLSPGQTATVRRVRSSDPGVLEYLGDLGLRPGVSVQLLAHNEYDDTLRLTLAANAAETTLGQKLSGLVWVELAESEK